MQQSLHGAGGFAMQSFGTRTPAQSKNVVSPPNDAKPIAHVPQATGFANTAKLCTSYWSLKGNRTLSIFYLTFLGFVPMWLLPRFLRCSGKNFLRRPIHHSNRLFKLYKQIVLSFHMRDFFMGVFFLVNHT
jgi:hypothetical protein